jgi:DNA polymerase I-like protein with 3'-5' exonuclease and polymerase domains
MAKPGPKIFANAGYDLGWFKTEGLEFNLDEVHDVLIMGPLIDENRFSYSLDSLAKDYLGMGKDETMLKQAAAMYGWKKAEDIKSNMWRMPAKYVGPYGERDPVATLELWKLFMGKIREQRLEKVYDLERKIMPIMLDMKQRGLRVDLEKARSHKAYFQQKEEDAKKKLNQLSGMRVDPYSADSCALVFDKFGIQYPLSAKAKKPSITADLLETIDHEVGQLIRDARRFQKAHATFIDSYILNREVNGRVYASFNQLPSEEGGTVSGRFSCSGPNLQNIPAKDPETGPMIRDLFLPEEGEYWMAADYANQEPRITVHWAYECKLDGSKKVVDRYREDPWVSYHKIVQDMLEPYLPEGMHPYKTAKTINLGMAYGMGGPKLCQNLGLPTKMVPHWQNPDIEVGVAGDEGQKILDLYEKEVPYIKELSKMCSRRAKRRGYITTFSGRRCRFPDGFEHKALNRLVQGSAADQTKYAMLKMQEKGFKMILTMHDEIGLSISSVEEAKEIAYTMENAIKMHVPFKCDIDVGKSWGSSKEINLEKESNLDEFVKL